jgi:gamma-glutamyl hydrolase
LFTGGGLDLHKNATTQHTNLNYNIFVSNAKKLMDWAKKANDIGEYFPVWGTCQGFELMLVIENNLEHSILTNVKNDVNVSRSLIQKSTAQNLNSSILNFVSTEALDYVSSHESLFYYHEWAVTE